MRRSAILFLLLTLVLVACRASTTDTTVIAGESTITPTGPSLSTSTTAPAPTGDVGLEIARLERELAALETRQESLRELLLGGYPLTIEADQDPVTLDARPERIVSLSATHTEILYAVEAGGQVIATDQTSNYPAAAADTVKVDSFNFSIEEVVALQPDLVILAFDFQGEAEGLSALGIPFLLMGPPETLEGSFGQILTVGAATGHYQEAVDVLDEMGVLADRTIRSASAIRGASIFHEVDETLYSATSSSFIGDLYRRLGLVNIADDADVESPFPQLSPEFIIAQDPEFIFLADADFGVTVESVRSRPGWETITAVSDGNVIALDGDMAGRWGPRTVDLMASILDAIQAGLP